ncbi:MAG TPA: ABC transporter ATP-binding protein [Bacilli bacterium]|nr:ABC transporter ATP-binding protein [Bacilli bacterium]
MKNNETFKNLKQTWKYVKKNKKLLIIYIIGSLLLSVIGAVTPILAAQALLKISNNLLDQLIYIAIAIFVVEVFRNIVRYVDQKYYQKLFVKTLFLLKNDVSKTVLKFETKVIDTNSSGVFIDRITNDTEEIAGTIANVGSNITDIITNIGILIAVLIVNKYIFIFFVVAMVILFWFKKSRMKQWFETKKEYHRLNEINTGLVTELIRGLRDIKVLNASKNVTKIVNKKLTESTDKMYETNRKFHTYRLYAGSVQDFVDLAFIFLAIFLTKNAMLSTTSFVILYMYRSKIYSLLDSVSRLMENIKVFNVSATRVYALLDSENYPQETFGNKHLAKIKGDFEFKNVAFGYNENRLIIKDLSFKIKANTTTAFVGKSGSGKTTIFSLLTKLYHINEGEILIDGVNIDELDEESIRSNITIITQTPYIFNFSIKENLRIVNEKAKDEEIIKACKQACLHDFIMSLPNKYDTLIGEGGVMLSGGERQRLAIARALLRKSEIILFDEATSSLDNETQKEIQKAINNIKGVYTVLIIAHRLSTVVDSERIIVIDQGEIVGDGTHKELYKENKIYRNLYEKELRDENGEERS